MEIAAIVDDHSHECTNEECQEKVANPAEREIGLNILCCVLNPVENLADGRLLKHLANERMVDAMYSPSRN